jgi:hypothetical protein
MPAKSLLRLSLKRPRIAALCLGCALVAVGSGAGEKTKAPPRPGLLTATLELAPGELGDMRSKGTLFLLTDAKGKEVVLFDSATGELTSYLETGATWGKPVRLRERDGSPFAPQAFRVEVSGDQVAFASPLGVNLFHRDTGEFAAVDRTLHHAADIEAMPGGDWVVDLTRPPIPQLELSDHGRFGGITPRLVVVDDKLEVSRYGLAAQSGRTGNASAARTLRLAASADRLYAAELANYRIYELDRRLKLLTTYVDPSLQLETGVGAPPDLEARKQYLAGAHQLIERAGKDASHPKSGGEVRSEFFTFQIAIQDIAWDPQSRQLAILLAQGIANDVGALDLLDPATGQVRRLLLRFPEGAPRVELSQLAVGHRYLWLRSHPGEGPTFRLEREALTQAKAVKAPAVERAAANEK